MHLLMHEHITDIDAIFSSNLYFCKSIRIINSEIKLYINISLYSENQGNVAKTVCRKTSKYINISVLCNIDVFFKGCFIS